MRTPRISEAEWDVMKVVWEEKAITANRIVDRLEPTHDWHPKTIKTLINRLVKKGALGYEKSGREYVYHPVVDQADCVRGETESFLRRVFNGALSPMLAHFIEGRKMSEGEISELKRMLNRKKS